MTALLAFLLGSAGAASISVLFTRRLRARERRFRATFEAAGIGIAILGRDKEILDANPAFERMVNTPRAELRGTRFTDTCGDAAGETDRKLSALVNGEIGRFDMEFPCVCRASDALWARAAFSAVIDAGGRFQFGLAVIENITDRKALEDQLRQSQKLEAVGRLAAGIAHDFNNLLTTINGLAELMLGNLAGAEHLREDVQMIRRAGQRAAALTQQLLAFGRKQILRARVLDLNATLHETGSVLRGLLAEDIELELSLDADVPAIKADPDQITQVILHLAANACDAMPGGGRLGLATGRVVVDPMMARRFDVEPGTYAFITVTDTGAGMDAQVLPHIFEPFFTTKEVGKGTGLGLASVYGIVKQSGGGIRVESRPGAGSRFTVLLPAHDTGDPGSEPAEKPAS